jgi:hypothetical protein
MRYGKEFMMKIVRIHAVYKGWPVALVVQTDTGEVLELSLSDLKEFEGTFEEQLWKELVDEYKVFSHSYH